MTSSDSWPVSTACTPGRARAAAVSIDTIRACACGERSTAACSMPGQPQVVDVRDRSAHERRVFLPGQVRADPLGAVLDGGGHDTASAARVTASTMC